MAVSWNKKIIMFAIYMNMWSPVLGNTLGHCTGVAGFSILLYLFSLDWRRSRRKRSLMAAYAAALALLWNIGDLVVLAPGLQENIAVHILHVISFSALTFLAALEFHIWLEHRHPLLWRTGYAIAAAGAGIHLWTHFHNFSSPHRAALSLVTISFGSLTVIAIILELRQRSVHNWNLSRFATAMCVLLLSMAFVYFDSRAGHFHHAGIPFSLFLLLIDYRFLLLDAFLRFAIRITVASVVALLGFVLESGFHFIERFAGNQFAAALAFIVVSSILIAFTKLSSLIEQTCTRLLFRRPRIEPVLEALRCTLPDEHTEEQYLDHAHLTIKNYFQCQFSQVEDHLRACDLESLPTPIALLEKENTQSLTSYSWAEAVLPLRFSRGDAHLLLLGSRRGGRRFLSEDIALLAHFGKIIEVQVERRRHLEMQDLASKAELRALQAQINPHFLFNSFNTLYGTISRNNLDARRLVLNLADVFRYFLRSDRTFITLDEELTIVKAYLEIESLRLGPKLTTKIQVPDDLLRAKIPVLSIQPLVENAVKHGVAPHSVKGFVSLKIWSEENHLKIRVINTGKEFSTVPRNGDTDGVGLANVRRRLMLCFGVDTEMNISSQGGRTTVGFSMPLIRDSITDNEQAALVRYTA
jgi:two-component system LytT family sensor kinase